MIEQFNDNEIDSAFDDADRTIIATRTLIELLLQSLVTDTLKLSRAKYFVDVNRLVDDMFKGVTFKSYLPMFNIYAVFGTLLKTAGLLTDKEKTQFLVFTFSNGGNVASCQVIPEILKKH